MEEISTERFKKQILLDNFGESGQRAINNASVLCIGAGGLGCPVLLYLASSGVKKVGIVDHDVISQSNLPRQILYEERSIGKKKAIVAKQKLELLNSASNIIAYDLELTYDNAFNIINQYDIVIDCTDNFDTRLIIGDITYQCNKSLIRGAVLQYEGQIAVFNYQHSSCHRCLFDNLPTKNNTISTDALGVLNTLCEIVGAIIVSEAIKIITNIGDVNSDSIMFVDILEPSIKKIKIRKKTNCQLCGK